MSQRPIAAEAGVGLTLRACGLRDEKWYGFYTEKVASSIEELDREALRAQLVANMVPDAELTAEDWALIKELDAEMPARIERFFDAFTAPATDKALPE